MASSSSSSEIPTRLTAGFSGFDAGPSSSSGFTDEEILAELQDLGYSLSPEQLEGLKKELDKIIEQDEVLERQQQAAYVQRLTQGSQLINSAGAMPQNELLDSLPESYQQLLAETSRDGAEGMAGGVQTAPYLSMGSSTVPSKISSAPGSRDLKLNEIEELLKMTEDRTRLMRQETDRLGKYYPKMDILGPKEREEKLGGKVDDLKNGGGPATKSVRFMDTVDKSMADYERQALRDLGQTIRENLPKGEKWSWQDDLFLPQDQLEKYLKAGGRVAKGDKLLEPTIRPVDCPEAGGLPFRHDPVKRFQLYRKEWAKHPAPGEKKRLDLRWKVREYMLRQDIPKLIKS